MTGPRDPREGEEFTDPATEQFAPVDPPVDPPADRPAGPPVDPPTEQISPVDPPTRQFPPADPPTRTLPPVDSGAGPGTGAGAGAAAAGSGMGSAAWSQYGTGSAGPTPTAGYPTAGYPTGGSTPTSGFAAAGGTPPGGTPPPTGPGGTGGSGDWDENGGRNTTPWMIAAALLAVLMVAGAVVWLASRNTGDDPTVAAPTTSRLTVTSTTRSTPTPTPTTPTTTGPPSAAERCTPAFVADGIGRGTTVRECDPEFLLVTRRGGEIELYTWRGDSWSFLAAPASDVCREQLEQLGVPDRFRRVFQPCGVTTSPSSSSPTSSPTTSPTSSSTPPSSETPTDTGEPGNGAAGENNAQG